MDGNSENRNTLNVPAKPDPLLDAKALTQKRTKRPYSELQPMRTEIETQLNSRAGKRTERQGPLADMGDILLNLRPRPREPTAAKETSPPKTPLIENKPAIYRTPRYVEILNETLRKSNLVPSSDESFKTVAATMTELKELQNLPTLDTEQQEKKGTPTFNDKAASKQEMSLPPSLAGSPRSSPEKQIELKDLYREAMKLIKELEKKKEVLEQTRKQQAAEAGREKDLQTAFACEKARCLALRRENENVQASIAMLAREQEAHEELRKKIHRHLQQLRGNIRVFCRVRPVAAGSEKDDTIAVSFPELARDPAAKATSVLLGKDAKSLYVYDRVFAFLATQQQIFEEVEPFLQSALNGDKVCIFAYGQTGSGKTFTMEGPPGDELFVGGRLTELCGVLPRAGHFIFREVERLRSKGYEYEVECSALEIYNEDLRDLLADEENQKQPPQLQLVMRPSGEVEVKALSWARAASVEQLMARIKSASGNRRVDKTSFNERSSRSHSIFQIRLSGEFRASGKKSQGLLSIVDLAGSERTTKDPLATKNERLARETKHINQSLTTLGRVLTLLAHRSPGKRAAIPYRESKLTRVLQGSLQPESKTLMFVNICPSLANLSQSKESLAFASTAALAS